MGIELIGIEKSWHKVPVLQQVSFRTAPGETLVLLGPSGAGKSSLLRMMNLLDTPDAGVLRIADSEFSFPSNLSAAEFNRFNARRLEMGDATVAQLRVGGNFRWSKSK